jgi:hypothetical protein
MMFVLFNSHTKDATSGAGTAYPAGEWSLIFSFLCSILLIFFCPDYGTGLALTTLVVIGTDCTGSCKPNYHTITAMTPPKKGNHNLDKKISEILHRKLKRGVLDTTLCDKVGQ